MIVLDNVLEPGKLLTKSEMAEMASREGYGNVPDLLTRFNDWQKLGILGLAIKKEERRGGSGLWHPTQCAIFLLCLRLVQDQKASTVFLCNIPVGFWIVRLSGIELEQVQKAFCYAVENTRYDVPERHTRKGKEYRQARKRFKTEKGAKRGLDSFFNFGGNRPGITLRRFLYYDFMFPETPVKNQNEMKTAYYYAVSDRLTAMRNVKYLSSEKASEYWEWARSFWFEQTSFYHSNLPDYQSISNVFHKLTFNELLENACLFLLGIFGYGIRTSKLPNPSKKGWLL